MVGAGRLVNLRHMNKKRAALRPPKTLLKLNRSLKNSPRSTFSIVCVWLSKHLLWKCQLPLFEMSPAFEQSCHAATATLAVSKLSCLTLRACSSTCRRSPAKNWEPANTSFPPDRPTPRKERQGAPTLERDKDRRRAQRWSLSDGIRPRSKLRRQPQRHESIPVRSKTTQNATPFSQSSSAAVMRVTQGFAGVAV